MEQNEEVQERPGRTEDAGREKDMTGGELQAHPLECADVGFFAEGHLPAKTALPEQWAQEAFAAIREEDLEVRFDAPRDPLWEGQENVLSFLEDPEEKESP